MASAENKKAKPGDVRDYLAKDADQSEKNIEQKILELKKATQLLSETIRSCCEDDNTYNDAPAFLDAMYGHIVETLQPKINAFPDAVGDSDYETIQNINDDVKDAVTSFTYECQSWAGQFNAVSNSSISDHQQDAVNRLFEDCLAYSTSLCGLAFYNLPAALTGLVKMTDTIVRSFADAAHHIQKQLAETVPHLQAVMARVRQNDQRIDKLQDSVAKTQGNLATVYAQAVTGARNMHPVLQATTSHSGGSHGPSRKVVTGDNGITRIQPEGGQTLAANRNEPG